MRIHEAGDSALLAELEPVVDRAVNARAIGLALALRSQRIDGVRDVVSTFRSVAASFDPLATDRSKLRRALQEAAAVPPPQATGRIVEVPTVYGGDAGPDLADVAAFAGCTPADVVERHASRKYRVYMLGFLPGYPYMGFVDEAIAIPRRAAPRLRVPAGSVGIAGRQTGIYPCDSPGGWQIIGRTDLTLFDPEASRPALFAPGDEVRFVVSGFSRTKVRQTAATEVRLKADTTYDGAARFITVLHPGMLTTIQDEGRWGYQDIGVPVAGAMDAVSHRLANAVLGNPRHAATLEATLVGPELRFEHDSWVAVAGADLQPTVDGAVVPLNTAFQCRAGSVLRFAGRSAGARAYIAVDGGIDVPPVLGSRATHLLSGLGGMNGRALRAGDRVPLGRPGDGRAVSDLPREVFGLAPRPLSPVGARLRILPGPQRDHFEAGAFEALLQARYTVSPQSDRMGYRLSGASLKAPAGEMISDAVVIGGLQVPPSGEPILLMADRQTTGGYPQLAVVITADLPRAAQLAPGDPVAFEMCTVSEALSALRQQEGQFDAVR